MYLNHLNSYLNKENGVLFNGNTMEFYQLDDNIIEIFHKLNANIPLSRDEADQIREIEESLTSVINSKEYTSDNITSVKINISNDCNLRCSYCYASHGNYGGKSAIMTKEMASKLAQALYNKFRNIEAICFFGGEPLMAVDAIQTICEFYSDKDVIFLMQTNGTIYNQKIYDLIKKYNIDVTVSIDGPKEIHDIHRVFPNGKGSYEIVLNNVKRLNKDTKSINYVQGTYTNQAAEIISKSELAKKIYEDFDIPRISIYDVLTTDDNKMKVKNVAVTKTDETAKSFIDDVFTGNLNNSDSLKLIFNSILSQKRNERFCNAGSKQLAIDYNGDLWPCQLFTNDEKYKIGNLYDSNEEINIGFKNTLSKLQVLDRENHKDCTKCISKFWCRKCVAQSLVAEEEITISKKNCRMYMELTKDTIEEISNLILSDKYDEFVSKFEKIYSMELL